MTSQTSAAPTPAPRARFSGPLLAAALAFAVGLLLWGSLYSASPLIYDTDSYYHLAIGRQIAASGIPEDLSGVRMSLLSEGFGDKEVLFHLLLAPFAALFDASPAGSASAGRWALAVLGALIFACLAGLARRAARGLPGARFAWLLPFALLLTSGDFAWRLVRLRPELLALALLLLALAAAATGRLRTVGALTFAFTLAYTAFHALVGLLGLFFLFQGLARRRWEWPLLLYTLLGAGLALVLHPHFPTNVQVWAVQNVQFFLDKGTLDVGTEIRPHTTATALRVNAPFWLALLGLIWAARGRRSAEPSESPAPAAATEDRRYADLFGLAALVFGLLYLLMSRFGLYAFPLISLWLLFELRSRGRWPGGWLGLPGGRRLALAVPLVAAGLIALLLLGGELTKYRQRTDPGPEEVRLTDRQALAAALPAGARVAAPWRATALYLFIAPQARYLNVLDPIFMAAPHPQAHRRLEEILDGGEPDVPAALALHLDSDHLAFSPLSESPTLSRRLEADPRVRVLHQGFHAAYRILPDANAVMVRDWRRVPADQALPALDSPLADWPAYAATTPGAERIEGYVDAVRAGLGEGCAGFAREVEIDQALRLLAEVAPYGPTSIWLDDRLVATVRGTPRAVVGEGIVLPLDLEPGRHRFSVLTCEGADAPRRAGFYWIERQRISS